MSEKRGAALPAAGVVAEHMLWLRRGIETTPLHIVKLVYLCHGWMLGIKEQPLIDEPIITGRYGPVIGSLYERYKPFGDGPIVGEDSVDHSKHLTAAQLGILNFVHTVYDDAPDTELSELTHEPGTPWSETYHKSGLGVTIPEEMIRRHYVEKVAEIREGR